MKKQAVLLSVLMLFAITSQAQTKETRNVGTFTKIAFRVPGKLYLRQGSPQKVEIQGKKDILAEIETDVEGSRLVIEKEGKWDWNFGDDDEITVYITVKDIEGLSVGGSGDLIGETKIRASDIDLNVSGSGNMKVEVEASGDIEGDVSGSGNIDLRGKCTNFNSDVSGSGKVILALQASGSASFGVSGSGKIEASGSASRVKTSISGSGKVLAANLETNSCEVRITGSGDVEINVKDELDANITGSGSVRYKGNPSKVNSHAAGSGSVRKL
ncbi:head GIN domain-containing protein [Chryseolinea sp. H1M3-3]|uniref:head GIN domain-containing protein n=1 Tax=Chryseolinea sp. H1M3-3 TaxID=3034144 RepID=UPI0023EDCCD9|nr:head GIN domain-containing protein [Chryseolinea sp. H1M3-3]